MHAWWHFFLYLVQSGLFRPSQAALKCLQPVALTEWPHSLCRLYIKVLMSSFVDAFVMHGYLFPRLALYFTGDGEVAFASSTYICYAFLVFPLIGNYILRAVREQAMGHNYIHTNRQKVELIRLLGCSLIMVWKDSCAFQIGARNMSCFQVVFKMIVYSAETIAAALAHLIPLFN